MRRVKKRSRTLKTIQIETRNKQAKTATIPREKARGDGSRSGKRKRTVKAKIVTVRKD